jgi:hypothetical protein
MLFSTFNIKKFKLSNRLIIFSAFLFLLLSVSNNTNAQRRKVLNLPTYDQQQYHFGFILGINHMLFSIKPVDNVQDIKWGPDQSPDVFGDSMYVYSITSSPTPGFSVGILANLRLGRFTDLRFIPTLSFGERLLNYNILRYRNNEPLFVEIQKSITSTIVEIPLEFRYKSKRVNNISAYVLGGAKYSLDLASQKKSNDDAANSNVKLNRNDFSLEAGVGFEFYTTYFKFGVETKMGYGFRNLVIPEDNIYSGSIDQLRSKVFLLSFTFE